MNGIETMNASLFHLCACKFACGLNSGHQLPTLLSEGPEITFHLQSVPESLGLAEESSETDGHGRSDRSAAKNNCVNCARRHPDGPSHRVLGDTHGVEVLLEQNLSRRDRWGHGGKDEE